MIVGKKSIAASWPAGFREKTQRAVSPVDNQLKAKNSRCLQRVFETRKVLTPQNDAWNDEQSHKFV